MQRYFLTEDIEHFQQEKIELTGEIYHHMIRVMRMNKKEKIFLVLPDKKAFVAEIVAIDTEKEIVEVMWVADETQEKELPIDVTIAFGIPKGEKIDWLAQKATELGVHALQPLETQYTVVKWDGKKAEKKRTRLQKIVQEAAEQSHRQILPEVLPSCNLAELVTKGKAYDVCLVAYEEAAKENENSALAKICQNVQAGQKVLAVFGPEGGLAPEEIALLEGQNFVVCGLGPRILRAETAPLYLLSALSFATELQHL